MVKTWLILHKTQWKIIPLPGHPMENGSHTRKAIRKIMMYGPFMWKLGSNSGLPHNPGGMRARSGCTESKIV